MDLFPTFCEMLGDNPPGDLPGRSLLGRLTQRQPLDEERHIYASARFGDIDLGPVDRENLDPDWAGEPDWRIRQGEMLGGNTGETVMVATPRWKYIRNTGEYDRDELYARGPGGGDFRNLVDNPRYSETARILREELDQFRPEQAFTGS
jgi:hypothetical protein